MVKSMYEQYGNEPVSGAFWSAMLHHIHSLEMKNTETQEPRCPCGCPHVTPLLYQCDAEGHIFSHGAWFEKDLEDTEAKLQWALKELKRAGRGIPNKDVAKARKHPGKKAKATAQKKRHRITFVQQVYDYIKAHPGVDSNDVLTNVGKGKNKNSVLSLLTRMSSKRYKESKNWGLIASRDKKGKLVYTVK